MSAIRVTIQYGSENSKQLYYKADNVKLYYMSVSVTGPGSAVLGDQIMGSGHK